MSITNEASEQTRRQEGAAGPVAWRIQGPQGTWVTGTDPLRKIPGRTNLVQMQRDRYRVTPLCACQPGVGRASP